MATTIGICNSALIKIGANRITSLSENNKASILCAEQYEKLKREVLRAHPWNFATKRAELGTLADEPAFEFDYALQLPADCLRVLYVDDKYANFKVEGRQLLINDTTAKIKYIYDCTDPSIFDDCFAEALAARLAAELAMALIQSNTLHEQMMALYEAKLRQARTMDAQEGRPDELIDDIFLESRY